LRFAPKSIILGATIILNFSSVFPMCRDRMGKMTGTLAESTLRRLEL